MNGNPDPEIFDRHAHARDAALFADQESGRLSFPIERMSTEQRLEWLWTMILLRARMKPLNEDQIKPQSAIESPRERRG